MFANQDVIFIRDGYSFSDMKLYFLYTYSYFDLSTNSGCIEKLHLPGLVDRGNSPLDGHTTNEVNTDIAVIGNNQHTVKDKHV